MRGRQRADPDGVRAAASSTTRLTPSTSCPPRKSTSLTLLSAQHSKLCNAFNIIIFHHHNGPDFDPTKGTWHFVLPCFEPRTRTVDESSCRFYREYTSSRAPNA